jgi:hypothetical protein
MFAQREFMQEKIGHLQTTADPSASLRDDRGRSIPGNAE